MGNRIRKGKYGFGYSRTGTIQDTMNVVAMSHAYVCLLN
jgi:hypothetical protein